MYLKTGEEETYWVAYGSHVEMWLEEGGEDIVQWVTHWQFFLFPGCEAEPFLRVWIKASMELGPQGLLLDHVGLLFCGQLLHWKVERRLEDYF